MEFFALNCYYPDAFQFYPCSPLVAHNTTCQLHLPCLHTLYADCHSPYTLNSTSRNSTFSFLPHCNAIPISSLFPLQHISLASVWIFNLVGSPLPYTEKHNKFDWVCKCWIFLGNYMKVRISTYIRRSCSRWSLRPSLSRNSSGKRKIGSRTMVPTCTTSLVVSLLQHAWMGVISVRNAVVGLLVFSSRLCLCQRRND